MRILLVEPYGGFIRLDRCMQSVSSWGGVYRFPLNLARIAAGLIGRGHDVHFIDLQADPNASIMVELKNFCPDLCILSSGFPSMRHDSETARTIKEILPATHVSTFGVAPTLLKQKFLESETWGFNILFDSIVIGGEPAVGYLDLISSGLAETIVESKMEKRKTIETHKGRYLFNLDLYLSPFNGYRQSYIEGSYGCPKECTFCVVPQLYGKVFSKRSPEDVVREFQYVIEQNGAQQISLWDEGTTFQRGQIIKICEGLIELRKSTNPALQNFLWNTRSTTALVDEEIAHLMRKSGLTGLTLGLESFDENMLTSTGKGTSISDNVRAINILKKSGIISIGHIVLGLPKETLESAERTIQGAIDSGVDIAQFYCAVPYPGTPLYAEAQSAGLIQVTDLTQYELCNPIMGTQGDLSPLEVGKLRKQAMRRFYTKQKRDDIEMLKSSSFQEWAQR